MVVVSLASDYAKNMYKLLTNLLAVMCIWLFTIKSVLGGNLNATSVSILFSNAIIFNNPTAVWVFEITKYEVPVCESYNVSNHATVELQLNATLFQT